MKLYRFVCYLLTLWFIVFSASPVAADNNSSSDLEPQTNGKAVVLMDAHSGQVLYERNCHEQLPPASLTKIMTGFLVAENGHLDQRVTVSEHAAETPESTVYLEPGEVLTRMELLYAAMLPSANDACVALAESVAGSEAAFLTMMNQKAGELGLKNTHFVNPHGLHDDNHYSSAYDMALLAKHALNNPVFAEVVSTKRKIIPWDSRPEEDRVLLNQNRLLYRYDDAVGVKTGYTKQAGNCVVGAAKRGDMFLVAVSMNSPTVYEDLEHLFEFGFSHYHMICMGKSYEISREVSVNNGDTRTVTAIPKDDVQIAVTDEEVPYLVYRLEVKPEVFAPVMAGDRLGTCILYLKGEQVGSIDLIAQNKISLKHSAAIPFSSSSKIISSKWFFIPASLVVLILLFRKSTKLQNGLKRLILLLLRKRIPSQYRRHHY